jgi:hypothetical protein
MACESETKNVAEKNVKVDNRSKKDSDTLKPENEADYDTVKYTYAGRVGKLPVHCTLFFAKDSKTGYYGQQFHGSYYYTTYNPETVYQLKGNFAIQIMPLYACTIDEKYRIDDRSQTMLTLSLVV